MDPARLRELLEGVQRGARSVDDAVAELKDLPFADLGYAAVDHHRALRLGAPEVILGLDLGLGDGRGEAFGCDLTEAYVVENSEYTT